MDKSASTEEYISLREKLIPIVMEVHKKGSYRFWSMALYWYIGDAIKSRGSLVDVDVFPYDDVSHKEISRNQFRPERVKWRFIRNVTYLAKLMAKSRGKVDKPRALFNISSLLVRYIFYKLIHGFKGSNKRKSFISISEKCSDNILSSAVYHLPICYVEDFLFYYNLTLHLSDIVDTRTMKNGFSVTYSSNLDKGRATRLEQHGAFYGELKNHKGTDIEAKLPDFFYTWGWSYEKNQVPGQPKRLINFQSRYKHGESGNYRILLAMPSHVYARDFEFLKNLYEALCNSLKVYPEYKVVIRPRPSKVEKNNIRMLALLKSYLGPDIAIDEIPDAAQSVKKSALVVCLTHPANMFMECLYVSHPVVAFSHSGTEYHPIYIDHVEDIKEIGLLYEDIDSFVRFFDENINDINGWRLGLEGKEKFVKYLKTYCGCNNFRK